jgi:hypothetical protein
MVWAHLVIPLGTGSGVQDIVHKDVTAFCSLRLTDQKFGGGDALREGAPAAEVRASASKGPRVESPARFDCLEG